MKKLLILSIAMLLSTASIAADYMLTITNKTGLDIYELYISHEDADDWEEDVLDEDEILEPDESLEIDLTDYDSALFDIKAVDEDGDEYIIYDANIKKRSEIAIRLADLSD